MMKALTKNIGNSIALAGYSILFLTLASCKVGGGSGSDGADVALKVDPGAEVTFVAGNLFFGAAPAFKDPIFKIYRNGDYINDAFSRSRASGQDVTQKYSKTEQPFPLDLLKVDAFFADGTKRTIAAYVGSTQPTRLDFASTLTVDFFTKLIKRPPVDATELERVSDVVRNGLAQSCFLDLNVQMPTSQLALRAAQNALQATPEFQALVLEFDITDLDIRATLGLNRPPLLTGLNPYPTVSFNADPLPNEVTFAAVSENQTRVFSASARDPDDDWFTARWYLNGQAPLDANVVWETKTAVPKAFWFPKDLLYKTFYTDSYDPLSGAPLPSRTRIDNLRLQFCDGGTLQYFHLQAGVSDINRAPVVVTQVPPSTVISEFVPTNAAATTRIQKIEATDPDGDPLYVSLGFLSEENVALSLTPNPATGIPIDGHWDVQGGSDKSSSNYNFKDPKSWLKNSQLAANKAPSSIRFNEAAGTVVLDDFPATGETSTVAYERFTPDQTDLVGIRFKDLVLKKPIPIGPTNLECTLKFEAGSKSFVFVCSNSHQTQNEMDFEIKAKYKCPTQSELDDGSKPNLSCGFIPAKFVNKDGSTDPAKRDEHTKYYAYLILRPSDKQARATHPSDASLGSIKTSLDFSDKRPGGVASFIETFKVQNVNVAPQFTEILRYNNRFTEDLAQLSTEKMSGWQQVFDASAPEVFYGERPLSQWMLGQSKTVNVFGATRRYWTEGHRWLRTADAPATSKSGLFSEYTAFFFDLDAKDSRYGRIRFSKYNSNVVTEDIRKIRYLGENDKSGYFVFPNFFKDGTNNFNDHALCRMTDWFTRDTALYGGLNVNDASFKSKPIHSDIKVICAKAATGCDKDSANLDCAKNLAGLNDAELNNNGEHFEVPIERFLWNEKIAALDMQKTLQAPRIYESSYMDMMGGSLSYFPNVNTWPFNFNKTYYVQNSMIGGSSWSRGSLMMWDSFWDANTTPLDWTNDSGERIRKVRLGLESSTFRSWPQAWQPTNNPNYGDAFVDINNHTVRWGSKFRFRDLAGEAIPLSEKVYYRNLSRGIGCRYNLRDRMQILTLTCDSDGVNSASEIPYETSHVVSYNAGATAVSKGSVVVLDANTIAIAVQAIAAGQTGKVSKSATALLPKRVAWNEPMFQDQHNTYAYNVYWIPASNHISRYKGATGIYAGKVARTAGWNANQVYVHVMSQTNPVIVSQFKLYPNYSPSQIPDSEDPSVPVNYSASGSQVVDMVDNSLEATPIKLKALSPTQNILDPAFKKWRVAIDEPSALFGKVSDPDDNPSQNQDGLTFSLSLVDPEALSDVYLVYRDQNNNLVTSEKNITCSSWNNFLDDPYYLDLLRLKELKKNEFALVIWPTAWCSEGIEDFTKPEYIITVKDKTNQTATLQVKPEIYTPPTAPMLYSSGTGGYNADGTFNGNGCVRIEKKNKDAGFKEYTWVPEDLFTDAAGKSMPVTDLRGESRYWVRHGTYELFAEVKPTTVPGGGLKRAENDCYFYAYHPYGKPINISFLKDSQSGDINDPKNAFVDPTADSALPGFDLGDFWLNPETKYAVAKAVPSNEHAIQEWSTLPKPSLMPNYFSDWKSDTGLTQTGSIPSDRADVSDYKLMLYRNPYIVSGVSKAYLVLSKESSLLPNQVFCQQDKDYYATLTADKYNKKDSHLPSAWKDMTQKIVDGNDPAPNALCYEIKPKEVADFIKIDTTATQQNYDLKFKVYALGDFIVKGSTDDLWCEAEISYSSGGTPSQSSLSCYNADTTPTLAFNYTDFSSLEQIRRDLAFNDPQNSSFNVLYENNWGYAFAYIQWGETIQGINPSEAPARLGGVIVVDTADPDETFPSRTVMPLRLRLRSQYDTIPVKADSFNLDSFNKQITEGDSVSKLISIRSEDPSITPLISFTPRHLNAPIPVGDLGTEFTQAQTIETDSVFQEFIASSTLNSYEQLPSEDRSVTSVVENEGGSQIPNSYYFKLIDLGTDPEAKLADYLPDLQVGDMITVSGATNTANNITLVPVTSVDILLEGISVTVNRPLTLESATAASAKFKRWKAPLATLQSRSFDWGSSANSGAQTSYSVSYKSPTFKDAHKVLYPWKFGVTVNTRFQMPLFLYKAEADIMVPDIMWDNDKNPLTPSVLLTRRASSFEDGAGGADLVNINGNTGSETGHHERNKAPCIVGKDFMPATLGGAGKARGTYCPTQDELKLVSGDNLYPGTQFYKAPQGRIGLDVSIDHKLVESNPGSGNFNTLEPTEIFEGEAFRVQFGVHDPNVVEGIEIDVPLVSGNPPSDSRFSFKQDPLITSLTRGAAETPSPGVTTQKDINGLSAQTEYALSWTLQDVHVGKILPIDAYDIANIGSPTPKLILKIQDRGLFPAPASEEVEMQFHGWDTNNEPLYRGILYSSMAGSTETEFRYTIDPSGSESGFNELVFAASDEDRGDKVFMELLAPESSGFILGETIFIELHDQDSNTELAGKTCSTWFSEKLTQSHPSQSKACMYVKYSVKDTNKSSMVWSVRVWDKPWWQHTDEYPGALAYYPTKNESVTPDPGYAVHEYSIPLTDYELMHPSPDLIQPQEEYISLVGQVGGSGFLLESTPMRVAYLGERYSQTFYFYTPNENEVICELSKRPQLSDTITNLVLPSTGQSLSNEEFAIVEPVSTPDPRVVGCKVIWKPILEYWSSNQGGMEIGLKFYEGGYQRAFVDYKLNPDPNGDPLDAHSSELDGARNLSNSIFNASLRPDTHLAELTISTANSEANGVNGVFTGSELYEWTFSYNIGSVEKSAIYPVIETWFLDGVPVSFDTQDYRTIFDSASAGMHTITLELFDGGSSRNYTVSKSFYVRNTALGVRSIVDSFFAVKPGFNPNLDRVEFNNLITGFNDQMAVVSLYNDTTARLELSAIDFKPSGTTASKAEISFKLNQLALLKDFDIGIDGIGLTNTAGTSTPEGLFAVPQFHTPLFLSISNGLFSNGIPRDSSQELSGLFGTRYEQVVGLSKSDTVNDGNSYKSLVLTDDTSSTLRNSTALWVQPPSEGASHGFLTFGSGTPEQIFDFRTIKVGSKQYALALTASGLHSKEITSGTWYTPWNFNDHGYVPTIVSAGSSTVIASPNDNPWGAGRLMLDSTNRSAGQNSVTVGLWVWKSSDKVSKFMKFSLNDLAQVVGGSQQEIENFAPSLKSFTGASQWPFRDISYISDRAKAAMMISPDKNIVYSIDFSGPTLKQNVFSFAGARFNSLSCHSATDTCFVFDSQALNLWRLK